MYTHASSMHAYTPHQENKTTRKTKEKISPLPNRLKVYEGLEAGSL